MNTRPGRRVMFVDDEEGVRASWNRFLGERGFDVKTAGDGQQAISYLEQEPVDVVVSDLRMPGLDGLQLLEWMHDARPDTRFILLTGYGNDEVERKARELGAFEYLNKPISPETLAAVITAAGKLGLMEGPAQARERDRARRTPVATPAAAPEARVAEATAVGIAEAPVVQEAPTVQERSSLRSAVEVAGGLVVAPLLGLAFVMFLPLIGFAAFFWFLAERIRRGKET